MVELSAIGVAFTGGTQRVQIVDVDVTLIVDSVVNTFVVGEPLIGVMVLVTGHEVTVV